MNYVRFAGTAAGALCSAFVASGAIGATAQPSSAEAYQSQALARKVLNLDVEFHWIAGTDRFWFMKQTPSGEERVFIDAATGRQVSPNGVARHAAGSEPAAATHAGAGDSQHPSNGGLGADNVVSPDKTRAVFRRGDDLWMRDLDTRQERRLTTDGQPGFGYGDVDCWEDIDKVSRRRNKQPEPLVGVHWSADGRYVIALRQDMRPYPQRLLAVEYAPPDGGDAYIYQRRVATARDPKRPDSELLLIDTQQGTERKVQLDPQALNDWALSYFLANILWWNGSGDGVSLITANRGGSRFGLTTIDLTTGRAREILSETAPINVRLNPFDYNRPNVHVLPDGKEAIWYSERSGYGHLYLFDTSTGRIKRQLTQGEWVVFDLLHVDVAKRVALFTAGPQPQQVGVRSGGSPNPYYRYLYRVSLDGGKPILLTPEVADHDFKNSFDPFRMRGATGSRISPSGRYFVDSFSSIDEPPTFVIRTTSGRLVAKVLTSDASALYATGWKPPERFTAKAADGTTDLYGVIFRPRDFDPNRRYPVIEHTYPGPQMRVGPTTFSDTVRGSFEQAQTFADAGFIVVGVDGRGTAYRSRAFRDAFLRTEDCFGAADHVAAIKALLGQHSYMDPDRIGVMGHSYGGYGSLRAMLLFPEFFKVAVSTVGPAEWFNVTHSVSVERFFGVPSDSAQARAYYDIASNTRLAPRLQGRVLLIYGGIDENVPLTSAFVALDAFINADKDIDMLVLPDTPHGVFSVPYAVRRSVQYFVDHLAGPVAR